MCWKNQAIWAIWKIQLFINNDLVDIRREIDRGYTQHKTPEIKKILISDSMRASFYRGHT